MRLPFHAGPALALQFLQWSSIALVPALDSGWLVSASKRGHLSAHLVRHALAAVDGHSFDKMSLPPRRLKDANEYSSTHGSEASSEVRHNGTHLVRHVEAKWRCVFPDGTCYNNHAPLEGLPDKMEACVEEKNLGPLTIVMNIDLHCAHMDSKIHCDSGLSEEPFDPFHTCTNDPNLLKATCKFKCKNGYPIEECTFQFDTKGVFNMSDKTIDTCSLHAECMSRYVESNQMSCSSTKENANFKPHWQTRTLPERGFVENGYRAPMFTPKQSYFSEFLWAVAVVAVILGAVVILIHLGFIPEPEKWREWRERGEARQTRQIAPYRAPPVRSGGSMQYVAPAAPEVSRGPPAASDQELERLSG